MENPGHFSVEINSAASLKAATIPVILHYSTADPLA